MAERQKKLEEQRIIDYLKVLSDSAEVDEEAKELAKAFLNALYESKDNVKRQEVVRLAEKFHGAVEQSDDLKAAYAKEKERPKEEWKPSGADVESCIKEVYASIKSQFKSLRKV